MRENEMKLLLPKEFKAPDSIKCHHILDINQYYILNGGRIRKQTDSITKVTSYFHNIKYPSITHPGENIEIEQNIPKDIFDELLLLSTCGLHKVRMVYTGAHDYEIDHFMDRNGNLVVVTCEIEYEYGTHVTIPDWIKDRIITDVTSDKRFANFAMAKSNLTDDYYQ